MIHPIDPILTTELAALTPEQQLDVLAFARTVREQTEAASTRPPGTPARDLLQFAGTLSDKDAAEIMAAVEEGCEQINYDAW